MKPFNLEEAKAGKPVQTRDGKDVRILAFDKKGDYHIVALLDGCRSEDVIVYRDNGMTSANFDSDYDLFMKAEKKEGWINLYNGYNENSLNVGKVFYTEREALEEGKKSFYYVATVKVEWEE